MFSSDSLVAILINTLLAGTDANGLVGQDDAGGDGLDDLHLDARDICAWPNKKPFVSGNFPVKVQDAVKTESRVSWNGLERRHLLIKHLPRVQDERLLLKANFSVAMSKFHLLVASAYDSPIYP